jgi:acyl carrier protein
MSGCIPLPTRTEILDKLRQLLAKSGARPPEAVTESTRLREDLGLDSFAAIELVFDIEDLLDVRIPQSAAVAFQTVGDVITFLSTAMAGAGTAASEGTGSPHVP